MADEHLHVAPDETTTAPEHRVRLRSVVAIMAIWMLLAVWFHRTYPTGIGIFSGFSLMLGIPATVLGLLPASEKDGWRRWVMTRVHRGLARRATALWLALAAGAVAVLGSVISSVRIETARGLPAEVHIVRGTQSRPDTADPRKPMTIEVGRDREVEVRLSWILLGSRWAHTRSKVSQDDRTARPWRPARWSYPDDFDEIVTLFVLPTTSTNSALRSSAGALRLVILGATNDTIVATTPQSNGLRVAFFERAIHADSLIASWTLAYRESVAPAWASPSSDSLVLLGMLAMSDTGLRRALLRQQDSIAQGLSVVPERVKSWLGARHERGRRPLHRGETVRFYFVDERGQIAAPAEVLLDRNPYPLLIERSHVNRMQDTTS